MIRGPGITAGVQSDELISAIDIPQTIEEIATGTTDPNADGRSFLPYAQNPTLRSTRPLLLEADTGPGQGNAGSTPRRERLGGQGRQGQGRGPRGRQEPRPGEDGHQDGRQRQLRPGLPGRSHLRYLYVLYANGQSELYDLLLDPAELRSKHADPRYRFVRKFLFGQLVALTLPQRGLPHRVRPRPAAVPKKKAKRKRKSN